MKVDIRSAHASPSFGGNVAVTYGALPGEPIVDPSTKVSERAGELILSGASHGATERARKSDWEAGGRPANRSYRGEDKPRSKK